MFRFRLDTVLRHRQRQVDAAARALREAVERLQRAQRERAALAEALRRLAEAGQADRARGREVARWRLLCDYLAAEQSRLRLLATREREAAAEVAARRAQLVEAHRAREALTRLRARRLEDWEMEERRRERRLLDEVAARSGGVRAGT